MLSLSTRSAPTPRLVLGGLVLAFCLVAVGLGYVISTGSPTPLLIAFVILCGLMLFLVPTWWAFLIYFTYSAFSPLFKYVASYNMIVHLAPTFILAPILLRWLTNRSGGRGGDIAAIPAAGPVKAFAVLACLMVFSPLTVPLIGLGGIISYVLPIVFFPLAFYELRITGRVQAFLALTVALSLVGSALTLIFVALGPHGVAALGPAFAQDALNPGNVYFDARGQNVGWFPLQVVSNVIGYMVALILLVALLARGGAWSRGVSLVVTAPAAMLLATALIASGVRVTISGGAVGILVVGLVGRHRAVLPALVGITFAGIVLNIVTGLTHGAGIVRFATLLDPAQALQSSNRTSLLQQIVPLAIDHPLGQGMGRVGPGAGDVIGASGAAITRLGYDNMLLAIMSELGVLGGILLVVIAIMFIAYEWRTYRGLTDPSLKSIALGCTAATIALTATWIAGPTLMQAPGSIYYWALPGLCFALPYIERDRAQRSQE